MKKNLIATFDDLGRLALREAGTLRAGGHSAWCVADGAIGQFLCRAHNALDDLRRGSDVTVKIPGSPRSETRLTIVG